jgi:hypothetical protein
LSNDNIEKQYATYRFAKMTRFQGDCAATAFDSNTVRSYMRDLPIASSKARLSRGRATGWKHGSREMIS